MNSQRRTGGGDDSEWTLRLANEHGFSDAGTELVRNSADEITDTRYEKALTSLTGHQSRALLPCCRERERFQSSSRAQWQLFGQGREVRAAGGRPCREYASLSLI